MTVGTNYYVDIPHEGACEHCSDTDTEIHLGKSSKGWRFSFADPESQWEPETAFAEWAKVANSGPIRDEYGTPVTYAELLELILSKTTGRSHAELYPSYAYATPEGFSFSKGEFS